MAQFNYQQQWKKVEELDQKGLPKSALETIESIYKQALKDGQEVQQLKALLFRFRYTQDFSEDASAQSLQTIDQEIKRTHGAARALLQSIKGEMVWQYLQQHRYQLYSRTALASDTSTDIATWGQDRLNLEISEAYLASLQDKKILQQTDLKPYDDVLVKGNARALRPALYDLLAHRALDYFKSGERYLNQPANLFELEDAAAFAPAADFAAHAFKTTDTTSLQFRALEILQELVAFHLKGSRVALLDVDLERIKYANQVGVMPDKEELYIKALEQAQQAYAQEAEVTQAMYLLAQYYYDQDMRRDTATGKAVVAFNICNKAIQQAPKSYGATQCQQLLHQITARALQLETELVNLPAKPFRNLVTYRNLQKIYLRVVPVNAGFRKELRDAQEDYADTTNRYWRLVTGKKALKEWEQALPNPNDYREHKAEIGTQGLPLGFYMILASTEADFSLAKSILALQFVHVSEISYINQNDQYIVLHRESGQPLEGVKLNIRQETRDIRSNKAQADFVAETYTTDKDGRVVVNNKGKDSRSVRFEWIFGKDTLLKSDQKYLYRYYPQQPEKPEETKSFLFTDRAIYRPGQTVYFKGIIVKSDNVNTNSKALADFKTTVHLKDANGEEVDSMEVTSNEYGSYSGKFRLPENRLNGAFSIIDTRLNANVNIQVEEYKRPKFYVEFDTVKGSYRVGDTISVHGKALAYAGNNIDGAQVKYRVVREARFPYYWMFSFKPAPPTAAREIISGQVQTGADGSFTIPFTALPDKTLSPDQKPIFTYRVYADVTDLNGETRSGQQRVAAGYQLLEVSVNIADAIQPAALKKVGITTANLNGAFEPAAVKVRLLPLQHPGRLIRPRYWEAPDQFVMTEEEYIRNFPLDVYKHEDDPAQWKRGTALLEKSFTTVEDSSADLSLKQIPQGWYELEVSATDRMGAAVVQKKTFRIWDAQATKLPYPTYLNTAQEQRSYEVGDKIQQVLGTTAKDLYVLQTIERKDEAQHREMMRLSDQQQVLPYTVTEKDRGGLDLEYTFVKDNRVFTWSQHVMVPWSNKTLELTLGTHRDKLMPGEAEKWQVQVKGAKKDAAAAEMLATMYDASLDAFVKHDWAQPALYPSFYNYTNWNGRENFLVTSSDGHYPPSPEVADSAIIYDALDYLNTDMVLLGGSGAIKRKEVRVRGVSANARFAAPVMAAAPPAAPLTALAGRVPGLMINEGAAPKGELAADQAMAAPPAEPGAESETTAPAATPRTNFNETAFFFPDLRTDKDGNITFEFTVPEALTRWRFLGFAHTKEMSMGTTEASIVTQKPLMVQPNAPRFMREGDRMEFSAKISNLSDSLLIGQARLELLDAATMQPVDGWFQNIFPTQHFTAQKGQSTLVTFPVQIPYNYNSALVYRVVAQSGRYSDGEQNALPVLSNSMLVTETLPLAMRGDGSKTFKFDKLLHSDSSETLHQHALTVEFTSNPAWYAVQALPYLMEYPHQCAEQVFNRYYANALATHIVNTLPGIKAVFDKWSKEDTAALQSNLQKNEELKSILLQQTPWVLEAKNESEQKAHIALLFDLHRMSNELDKTLEQLKQMQLPSGAFPWFNGMWEDRFITQYIVAGLGRLQQLDALTDGQRSAFNSIKDKALNYLDLQMDKQYHSLLKSKADMKKQQISGIDAHYLYLRSFYKDQPVAKQMKAAYDFYLSQAKTFWRPQNRYVQAMIAIALHRSGDNITPAAILRSLKEFAIHSEEMGMYWKEQWSYYWHQAPIESQAMLIEAFDVVAKDSVAVNDMKTWLLKNKQTNNWHTTKATADACYAMLLTGNNWLAANPQVTIQLGNETISSANQSTEAGTGYFKQRLEGRTVKPEMGNIQVSLQQSQGQPAWGAIYWQYFEQLDKITPAQTPLSLQKELFIQQNTEKGPVLTAITDGNTLKIGDRVKVRVVLKADRDMEYIHLRDMRAACFEPLNVISSSKWQDGLSYYESTKDASTDFFFSYLPKGTHVFEYTLFVTHEGEFSNGISIAECMYAPEFSAHSAGMNVKVTK